MCDDTASSDRYREAVVEAEDGSEVQVEEYPGGDMTVYKSGGESLYFSPEQATALRSALGRIDGGKRQAEQRNRSEPPEPPQDRQENNRSLHTGSSREASQ